MDQSTDRETKKGQEKVLGPPVFMQSAENSNYIKHIAAPDFLREGNLNDVMIIKDVLLTGHGPFALWNYQEDPVLIAESVHYGSLLENVGPRTFKIGQPCGPHVRLNGDYAILANVWSVGFYHWFEELSRALMLESAGFTGKYIVHGGPPFVVESLELLGISADRLISYEGIDLVIEHAWFTPRTDVLSWVERPRLFWRLRSVILEKIDRSNSSKVFLVRGKELNNKRNLINIQEVCEVAAEFDYASVDPAEFSFREQVSFIASAPSVMGMHGAAFCHCMFMRKNSSVIEFFSPNYINYTSRSIHKLLKHRYAPLVSRIDGVYPYGEDALVDCDLLKIILENTIKD